MKATSVRPSGAPASDASSPGAIVVGALKTALAFVVAVLTVVAPQATVAPLAAFVTRSRPPARSLAGRCSSSCAGRKALAPAGCTATS